MRFEWNEAKRRAVMRKHGIDLADIPRAFRGPVVENYDYLHSDTDDRWWALALLDGRVVVVIYTERGDTIRLISARYAGPQEAGRYWKEVGDDTN